MVRRSLGCLSSSRGHRSRGFALVAVAFAGIAAGCVSPAVSTAPPPERGVRALDHQEQDVLVATKNAWRRTYGLSSIDRPRCSMPTRYVMEVSTDKATALCGGKRVACSKRVSPTTVYYVLDRAAADRDAALVHAIVHDLEHCSAQVERPASRACASGEASCAPERDRVWDCSSFPRDQAPAGCEKSAEARARESTVR